MLILVNRKRLMGDFSNGFWGNLVAGGTSVIMVLLTIALIWNSITGA
jgi:Mn2+/Fe2+ NRAMP family transporter